MLSVLVAVLLSFCTLASARPPISKFQPEDAPGRPVRDDLLADLEGLTRNSRDCSGKAADPPAKYFHESTFDAHYDGRFASFTLSRNQRLIHLRALVRSYLETMRSLGAETWIMHGSLLGWWWNKNILPWDSDIDVQVSESAMEYLATYYNMTVYKFSDTGVSDEEEEERKYLLEINPHYKNDSTADWMNVIDARWIDTTTGLYIDITALRVNRTFGTRNGHRRSRFPPSETPLYCKDNHHYTSSQIFPLRETTFEGVPAKVPYSYQQLLIEEYGDESLVNTEYEKESHVFDGKKKEWVPVSLSAMRRIVSKKRQREMEAMSSDDEEQGDDADGGEEEENTTDKHLLAWFIREGEGTPRRRRPRRKSKFEN